MPVGPSILCPGERIEIAAKRLHVHHHVADRLSPVDKHRDAAAMRETDDLLDRVRRPERVRDVHDRDEAGSIVQQLLVRVQVELARVAHRDDAELCPFFLAQHLPRHDIGVVLHHRDHDRITVADLRASVTVGHEIDGLGRAAHEHDLPRLGRVEEPGDRGACGLVGLRRPLAEPVNGAMNVGILLGVETRQAIDDHLRLLRGRGAVEIDERPAVNGLRQDRKILADRRHVERHTPRRHRRHDGHLSPRIPRAEEPTGGFKP
jgi:hypothetical protein